MSVSNEKLVEKLRKCLGDEVREDVEEWVGRLTDRQKETLFSDADVYVQRKRMKKERKMERLEQIYRGDCHDPSDPRWEEAIARAHREVYGTDY